ncbi:MAG: hypothetical protein E7Z87_05955 [Cyanobacteria bacterium SIG26]|nr:hypothetical protein [Cyanobacteria bacterium SIG26]
MLAQAVKNNLKDIKSLKMRQKTSPFSNFYQSKSIDCAVDSEVDEVLAGSLLTEYPNDSVFVAEMTDVPETKFVLEIPEYVENIEQDEEYLFVENPKEAVVTFPVVSGIVCEEKLPFFKSLSFKLANL